MPPQENRAPKSVAAQSDASQENREVDSAVVQPEVDALGMLKANSNIDLATVQPEAEKPNSNGASVPSDTPEQKDTVVATDDGHTTGEWIFHSALFFPIVQIDVLLLFIFVFFIRRKAVQFTRTQFSAKNQWWFRCW